MSAGFVPDRHTCDIWVGVSALVSRERTRLSSIAPAYRVNGTNLDPERSASTILDTRGDNPRFEFGQGAPGPGYRGFVAHAESRRRVTRPHALGLGWSEADSADCLKEEEEAPVRCGRDAAADTLPRPATSRVRHALRDLRRNR